MLGYNNDWNILLTTESEISHPLTFVFLYFFLPGISWVLFHITIPSLGDRFFIRILEKVAERKKLWTEVGMLHRISKAKHIIQIKTRHYIIYEKIIQIQQCFRCITRYISVHKVYRFHLYNTMVGLLDIHRSLWDMSALCISNNHKL